jgi:proteasome lid subunit RPN8/RPN11
VQIYLIGRYYCLMEAAMLSRSDHLLLPRHLYTEMVQHAQTELPNECCGVLAGVREGDVLRVLARHPLINAAASPIEYLSEPRSMFDAVKAMRTEGHEILAIYHSHPTSEPIPSKTDLGRNYSPDVVNFIISLAGPEPVVRGWWLTDARFAEAAWEIVEA